MTDELVGNVKGVYFHIIDNVVLVLGREDDNVTSSMEMGFTNDR